MPGSRIGRNVIIGAGSVVRGEVPDNSIVIGNPAHTVGDTLDWGRARLHILEEGRLREDPPWMGALNDETGHATLVAPESHAGGDEECG